MKIYKDLYKCGRCKQELPFESFYEYRSIHSSRPVGSYCKQCAPIKIKESKSKRIEKDTTDKSWSDIAPDRVCSRCRKRKDNNHFFDYQKEELLATCYDCRIIQERFMQSVFPPDVEVWLKEQYKIDVAELREQHRKNMLDIYGIVID